MIRRYAPVTILLFSLLLTNGNCEDASDKNFKTECFTEAEEATEDDVAVCEDSRINIKGTFYRCESALRLKSPIKRIGFKHEDVLILSGRQTFLIDGNTSDIRNVRRIAPVVTQLIDRRGNLYYGGNNVVYVQRQQDNDYVEVLTHSVPDSSNDITLDEMNDNLFILSHFEDENTSVLRSVIYILHVSELNKNTETVKADEFSELKDITSIAYNSVNNHLYMGVKLASGEGKLIKIRGQPNDPCAINESYKQDITSVVNDFQNKILQVFDKSATSLQSRVVIENESDKVLALEWENEQLKQQLNVTIIQLNALRRRIYQQSGPGYYGSPTENDIYSEVSGGVEERMGSTPRNQNKAFSVNIMISPPQIVPLNVNGLTAPNSLLFSPISINIGPGSDVRTFVSSDPPVIGTSTYSPPVSSPQSNENTVTLARPNTTNYIASPSSDIMPSSSELKSVAESDFDYSFE